MQTKVIFNYDQDNFYFAFICEEPNIEKLKNEIRENSLKVWNDDSVEIMIDADNNKADYYHFLFNPSGFYGTEFRTQGGFVSSEVKDFKLYTGSSIDKDRWILEVVIPYSSITLEKIQETFLLNLARTRRIDLKTPQQGAIAEKGQFNNPNAFIPIELKNVDLSLYALELKNLEIVDIEKKEEKIGARIKGILKNLSDRQKNFEFDLIREKEGILDKAIVCVPPKQEKEFFLTVSVPEEQNYRFEINIKDRDKLVYRDIYSTKIEYIPITLELLKPFYRNSIFSTQKLDEIKVKVKIWLKEDEIKGSNTEILILGENQQIITKKLDKSGKESIFSLPVPQKDGKYTILARLLKENKLIYQTGIPLYKLPPTEGNEVYVDENLNLILNGKPIMPLIWWGEMSLVEEIARTGADGLIIWFSKRYLDDLNKLKLYAEVNLFTLDELKKYLAGRDTLSDQAKEDIIKKINAIKDHPALLFYYLVDEPEIRNVSPNILKEAYNLIKEIDPYHPVQITNDTVKGITAYIDCADLFFPDPYIHPTADGFSKQPMKYIIPFMEEVRKAGGGKKFIGMTPQVFDYGKVYARKPPHSTRGERAPTFVEERCMNYLGIVYGAKGFNYYVYGRKEEGHWGAVNIPDLRIGMPYLIKEKKSLSDVILLGRDIKEQVLIQDRRIHYSAKELGGNIYIIAVNIEPVEIKAEIIVPKKIKKIKVLSENRMTDTKNGIFLDTFEPYQVHIYTSNLDFVDVVDLKKVEEEIKKEGGFYTLNYR